MSTQDENLSAALALVATAVKIIPADANKRPLFKNWQENATTDTGKIHKNWERAQALPAIPCGPNGLLVIDCDRHNGAADGVANFKMLVENHGGLPRNTPV